MIEKYFDEDGFIDFKKAIYFATRTNFVNNEHRKLYKLLTLLIKIKDLLEKNINSKKIIENINNFLIENEIIEKNIIISEIKNWLSTIPEDQISKEEALIEMIINKIIWIQEEINYIKSNKDLLNSKEKYINSISFLSGPEDLNI